jgi:peptidoglycan-associated lipoprotein
MRRNNLIVILFIVGVSAAFGQQISTGPAWTDPRFDVSIGYNFINANAPPGQSDYFGINGGYVSGGVRIKNWLGVEAKVTGGHANDISLLGQDLTLMTYLAGPKVSMHRNRLTPFAQALFGGAHGSDSYFPTATSSSPSASSFAYSAGGGLDVDLTRRFAIRAADVEYLHTALPNGTTNAQNHIMIGVGLVMNFGGQDIGSSPVTKADKRSGEIDFTCSTNVATIEEGQVLEVVGHTMTEPDHLQVSYSWSSSGGNVQGNGRLVTIKTAGLAAGDYHVRGKAALISNPATTADCDTEFRVNSHTAAASPAIDPNKWNDKAELARQDVVFHENVQDALFDYDSYDIRPDGQIAIEHAAKFLHDNPSIHVRIEGFADDRGSAEYNLALGERRANAARNALLAAGVAADRLQIISFGKEAQLCTEQTESCWQQNRRAAFSMHP